jgi:hypothetical protein
MILLIVFHLFFGFSHTSSLPETRVYEVKVLGMNTGEFRATREKLSGQMERYKMETHAGMKYLLGKTEASFNGQVLMKAGFIESMLASNVRDGKLLRETRVRRESEGCVVETLDKKYVLSQCPSHCVSWLFFNEPVGVKELFSEDWGQMVAVQIAGTGKYEVKLPDGKSNFYHYENGKMILLESSTPVGKATVRLISG